MHIDEKTQLHGSKKNPAKFPCLSPGFNPSILILLFYVRSSAVAENAVTTAETAPDAAEVPEVDAAQPSTMLQIRLHDGRRVRAQLNMHHTVRHVQAIIARWVALVVRGFVEKRGHYDAWWGGGGCGRRILMKLLEVVAEHLCGDLA